MAGKKDFSNSLRMNQKNTAADALRKLEVSIDGFEKIIPHEEMCPSEDNLYQIGSLDELKESLRNRPLLHNLIVIPIEDSKYKYKILAGERRYRAIGELLEEGNEKYKAGLRCLVIDKNTSELDQKIIMEESNLNQREYSPKDRREAIERLAVLYKQKNEAHNLDIPISTQIAEKTGLGVRQAQRYLALENLIPELKEAFDNAKINLEKAASFSKMDSESQLLVIELLNLNMEVSKKEVELFKQESEKKEKELNIVVSNLLDQVRDQDLLNNKLAINLKSKDVELNENRIKTEELQKKIYDELKQENPDQILISQLNDLISQLKTDNNQKENEKDDISKQMEQQQRELNNLRKELLHAKKENVNNKPSLSDDEKAKLKDSFEIENIVTDLKKGLNQLLVKGESFYRKYNELPIDHVYDEIIHRLEEDKSKLLKGVANKV